MPTRFMQIEIRLMRGRGRLGLQKYRLRTGQGIHRRCVLPATHTGSGRADGVCSGNDRHLSFRPACGKCWRAASQLPLVFLLTCVLRECTQRSRRLADTEPRSLLGTVLLANIGALGLIAVLPLGSSIAASEAAVVYLATNLMRIAPLNRLAGTPDRHQQALTHFMTALGSLAAGALIRPLPSGCFTGYPLTVIVATAALVAAWTYAPRTPQPVSNI